MWLSLGGFHEASDKGKMFNTHVVVSGDGEVVARCALHSTSWAASSVLLHYSTAVSICPSVLFRLVRQRTVSRYRKIHLFDVDLPDGLSLKESRLTIPGSEVCAC